MNDFSSIEVCIITKNAEKTLNACIKSVYGWVKNITVIDDYSSDKTKEIVKKFHLNFFQNKYLGEGSQRNFALSKCTSNWILILDADEIVPKELKSEILIAVKSNKYDAYFIPIQSYLYNHKLYYGGENYKKLILFKRSKAQSTSDYIHAHYIVATKKIGLLNYKIDHYSYLSISSLFSKFTSYSIRLARQKKTHGEKSSLKKICLYPPHMFYARYIKDKGYKDTPLRVFVDIAFSYMELLTYILLPFVKPYQQK